MTATTATTGTQGFCRGGPDPAWWDRWYGTERPEWIDMVDHPDHPSRSTRVLRGLNRFQHATRAYPRFSSFALAEARDVAAPRVLELGAGRGQLGERMLRDHPRAHVTVSDISAASVAVLRSGALGRHPRADVRQLDATAVDADDGSWDVAVLTMTLHHLGPDDVRRLLTEGTRVARRLVLVDAWRHPVMLATLPVLLGVGGWATTHDGVISLRKMYSTAALHTLADTCGRPVALRTRVRLPGYLVATVRAVAAA